MLARFAAIVLSFHVVLASFQKPAARKIVERIDFPAIQPMPGQYNNFQRVSNGAPLFPVQGLTFVDSHRFSHSPTSAFYVHGNSVSPCSTRSISCSSQQTVEERPPSIPRVAVTDEYDDMEIQVDEESWLEEESFTRPNTPFRGPHTRHGDGGVVELKKRTSDEMEVAQNNTKRLRK